MGSAEKQHRRMPRGIEGRAGIDLEALEREPGGQHTKRGKLGEVVSAVLHEGLQAFGWPGVERRDGGEKFIERHARWKGAFCKWTKTEVAAEDIILHGHIAVEFSGEPEELGLPADLLAREAGVVVGASAVDVIRRCPLAHGIPEFFRSFEPVQALKHEFRVVGRAGLVDDIAAVGHRGIIPRKGHARQINLRTSLS